MIIIAWIKLNSCGMTPKSGKRVQRNQEVTKMRNSESFIALTDLIYSEISPQSNFMGVQFA